MSNTTIPDIDISSNFGTVNKVVWFSVSNINGIFNVNFFITPNQLKDVNITIFNKETKETMYSKRYAKSANTTQINEVAQITHIPNLRSNIYGIKNN